VWVIERTISSSSSSWLNKRRGIRTRWLKKAENWLAFSFSSPAPTSCSTWRFSDRVLDLKEPGTRLALQLELLAIDAEERSFEDEAEHP
jgi:hypothetical protein